MSDLDKNIYKILKEVDSEDRFDESFINLQVLSVKSAFLNEGWTASQDSEHTSFNRGVIWATEYLTNKRLDEASGIEDE